MKLSYKRQLILSCIIIIVANVLNAVLKSWVCTSVGFCLCGLLWLVHPVLLPTASHARWAVWAVRGCGLFLIVMGLLVRVELY